MSMERASALSIKTHTHQAIKTYTHQVIKTHTHQAVINLYTTGYKVFVFIFTLLNKYLLSRYIQYFITD